MGQLQPVQGTEVMKGTPTLQLKNSQTSERHDGMPTEVASLVSYLASKESHSITGEFATSYPFRKFTRLHWNLKVKRYVPRFVLYVCFFFDFDDLYLNRFPVMSHDSSG